MTEVLIVGAGPVGLLLGSELARHGVTATLVERRAQLSTGTRAIGVHPPVLAALEPSGITERLLATALPVSRGEARSRGRTLGSLSFDCLSTRFRFIATLPQSDTEAALAAGAPAPRRGVRVTRVSPERRAVRVAFDDGAELTAPIVVIAGGWSSRGLAYQTTAAHAYRDHYVMADIPLPPRDDADRAVIHLDAQGVLESLPLPGGRRRFVAWDSPGGRGGAAAVDRLRAALVARGEDDAASAVPEATEFGVRRFTARGMRNGGLLVVGDAAHEVSPIGGQGMNLGLLDAAGLAPLLVRWVRTGEAPDAELARWERMRITSARRAARLAAVNTALGRPAGTLTDAGRRAAIGAALATPSARALAWLYTMGLDRAA